jgi:hypothetical protein
MMKRILVFVLFALGVSVATAFCAPAPSPEQYAAATATLMRAHAIATTDALQAHAQATRAAMDTYATATAIPMQLSVTASTTARDAVAVWVWMTLGALGLCGLVIIIFALGLLARTRARIVPRDASGQLPAFWDERTQTLADPSRMVGPAITLPRGDDTLVRVATTDAGADADHLLAAAQASLAATAVAAMFRPDNAERGRDQKLNITKSGTIPLQGMSMSSAPMTRVVVAGDSAVREIAAQLGDRIPLLERVGVGRESGERASAEAADVA